jgi:hypothetical protein
VVKGGGGKAPSGVGGLPSESGTEAVENGVEPHSLDAELLGV